MNVISGEGGNPPQGGCALSELMTFIMRCMQGHGHWVNTLALSTEYVLRTGPFDHTEKTYKSADEIKQVRNQKLGQVQVFYSVVHIVPFFLVHFCIL